MLDFQPPQRHAPADHADASLLGMTFAQHGGTTDSMTVVGVELRMMDSRQCALVGEGYMAEASDLRRLAAVLCGMARMMEITAGPSHPEPPIAIPPVPAVSP